MRATISPIPVDVLQSWLDVVAVWAAVGAAVVTAVTAVLIWLQIRQTKRSVQATERTLEIAMAEQELNRQLIVDAQKARIDSELPKLLVWIALQSNGVFDPRYRDEYAYDPVADSYPREIPDDRVWVLPDDGDIPLAVSLTVSVSNDGTRRAQLRLALRGDPESGDHAFERVLSVGASIDLRVTRSHTIAEWAAIASHDYSPLGEVGEHGWNWDVLTVTYVHQGTEGAIERWVVRQGGSPLIRVAGSADRWTLGPIKWQPGEEGGLNAGIDMPSRDYYSSMADQRRL